MERFWFIAVQGSKGYCLFDRQSTLDAVRISLLVSRDSELTPAVISSHFVLNEADFELMASKEAISLGKCIDVPFEQTKYRIADFDFSVAESAIHQSESISIFPLVREGSALMLAGFPTPMRAMFEPNLIAHGPALGVIFQSHFASLKQLRSTLERHSSSLNVGKLGQFIGGFTKAFLDQ